MISESTKAAIMAAKGRTLDTFELDLYRSNEVDTDFGPAKSPVIAYRDLKIRAKQIRADEIPDGMTVVDNVRVYRAVIANGIEVKPDYWLQNRAGTIRLDVVGIDQGLDNEVRYLILSRSI
jgi:hypothetical protein